MLWANPRSLETTFLVSEAVGERGQVPHHRCDEAKGQLSQVPGGYIGIF